MTAAVSPGVHRLHQIAQCVHDPARALAFYRDVLGLPLLFTAPPNLAFFDCAGVRLMLSHVDAFGPVRNVERPTDLAKARTPGHGTSDFRSR